MKKAKLISCLALFGARFFVEAPIIVETTKYSTTNESDMSNSG